MRQNLHTWGHPQKWSLYGIFFCFSGLTTRNQKRVIEKTIFYSIWPLADWDHWLSTNITKNITSINTFSDGCLGSHNDEERSEMRYVMRIAESSESSKLWTHLALPFGGVCLLECLFIPPKILSGSFWSRMCHSFSLKKPQIPRWQMNKNSTSFILFAIMFSFFYTKESYYSNTMTMRRHNYLI